MKVACGRFKYGHVAWYTMAAKPPETCWDFWKCEKRVREKCPAYDTGSGKDCWMVADSFVNNGCPRLKNSFKACWECPWFKKVNPDF